jgi:hypothetical protein
MIELLFVACLSVTSPACEERTLTFLNIPVQTCLLRAQGELASWSDANPGWTIRRWSCHAYGSREQEA